MHPYRLTVRAGLKKILTDKKTDTIHVNRNQQFYS